MSFRRGIIFLPIIALGFIGVYNCNKKAATPVENQNQRVRIERIVEREESVEERRAGKSEVRNNKKNQDDKTLGDVLSYIERNPTHQELIINYTIDLREENKLSFSRKTVKNLANVVKKEVEAHPTQMKDYILDISEIGLKSSYGKGIFDKLSPEQKWEIFKEISKYKFKEGLEDARELAEDAYDKFKETKAYDRLEEMGEDIKEEGKNIYRKIKDEISR